MSVASTWRLLGLAVLCGLAALLPALLLGPLEGYLQHSRTPGASLQAARVLLGATALACAALALAWPRARRAAARLSFAIVELPRRRYWLLVLALAAAARLAVALVLPYQPFADARWYHETAASLARGEGLAVRGEVTGYRFPGYSFALSLVYRLFGPHHELAWIWGIAATAALLVVGYRLADRLYGRAAARLATLGLATYPALALRTGTVMSDLFFAAALLVLVAGLCERRSDHPAMAALLGLGLGGLALTRGEALGIVAIAPAVWRLRGVPLRRTLVSSLLVATTTAACLVPWLLRNHRVFGRPLLATNLGTNLYIGNHPGASGGFNFDRPEAPSTAVLWNEAQEDGYLGAAALEFLRQRPLEAILLLPKKLLHFYLLETSAVTELFQGRQRAPAWVKYGLYGLTQGAYLVLISAFLFRLAELFRPGPRPRGLQWTGWLLIGYFTLIALVFFGQDRFRLPILPWMVIEAVVASFRRLRLPDDTLPSPAAS